MTDQKPNTEEQLDCKEYGCTDPYLSENQRKEAHEKHVASLNIPVAPKLAFCDMTHQDKTHHTDVYCAVMKDFNQNGSLYKPRTNERVILGLYPTACSSCT
jgi:hypothetical protein